MASMDRSKTRELTDSPSLPTDIWFEVLLRVPVKQVMRLKCVCRGLRDLITDRLFFMMHPDGQPRFLVDNMYLSPGPMTHDINFLSFDFGDRDNGDVRVQARPLPTPVMEGENPKFSLCDSFNGLVLLSLGEAHQLILYNPVRRSYEALPTHDLVGVDDSRHWEIVHDAPINQYTVIGLQRSRIPDPRQEITETPECVMLDRSSSSWKELALPRGMEGKIRGCCARKNGKMYWLICRGLDYPHSEWTRLVRTSLLCFDPAEQQFGIMPCSPMPAAGRGNLYRNQDNFFVYDGTFFRAHHISEYSFELWTLRDGGVGRPMWLKQHVIEDTPSIHEPFLPEAVLQGTGKLIMISCEGLKLAVYDMISKEWAYPNLTMDDEDEKRGIQLVPHILLV